MNVARRTAAGVLALVLAAGTASAQNSPFTPDDMLKVAAISVLDLTEDGRFVAATVRRPIDNPTVDHRRFGDPTYLAPSLVTLQIIDTRIGPRRAAVQGSRQRSRRGVVERRPRAGDPPRARRGRGGRLSDRRRSQSGTRPREDADAS